MKVAPPQMWQRRSIRHNVSKGQRPRTATVIAAVTNAEKLQLREIVESPASHNLILNNGRRTDTFEIFFDLS